MLQSTLQCATDFVSSGESLCKLRVHICVEVACVLFHQAEVSRSLEKPSQSHLLARSCKHSVLYEELGFW
jgi:hypothetical protein